MTDHAKKIIDSCKTDEQLDTCIAWVEYIYLNEDQVMAKAYIQQKRNHIQIVRSKFTPEHINEIQQREH